MNPPQPNYVYGARFIDNHDGDTYTFLLSEGLYDYTRENIRLRGYSAPELDQPGGPEAQAEANRILSAATVIVVQTYKVSTSDFADPRFTRTFSRYVADVWVDDSPLWVLMGDHVHPGTHMGIPHGQ